VSEPLVSILIPAFNAERWIGPALESALGQTWSATEVIVVDDGSDDETLAVLKRHASDRLRVVRQDRRGQSAAENRALKEAQGDFIQYLDADDLLSPAKVARQMSRLAEAPSCVASGEWARFYDDPGDARFECEAVWRDLPAEEWLVEAWTGGEPMMQAGIWLIPRAVAEQAGPWDETLSLINDFDYFTRVLLASDGVRFCEGARLFYRSGNPESLASRRSARAWRSALRSLRQGTRALLTRTQATPARRAAADVFQRLAFDAYLEDDEVFEAAQREVIALGGSDVRMGGGVLFQCLRTIAGWKTAKRVKQAAYAVGYNRIARAKETVLFRH
jgi:glycosyltransferase involved in cell wall biosynthesis